MGNKEDYIDKIEAHRQSIEDDSNGATRMSRVDRHSNNKIKKTKKKKERNPLITFLLIIFIFIPLTILVYVSFFYKPNEVKVEKTSGSENVEMVEVETNAQTGEGENSTAAETPVDDPTATADSMEQSAAAAEQLEQNAGVENDSEPGTHVVQANETLYSIAMKYYGDPSGVEIIKQANYLSSEVISTGQTLTIPKQ